MPAAAIVVRVTGGDGVAVSGTTVVFTAQNAQVGVPGGAFGTSANPLTDSRGEVAAMIRFGGLAGSGSVAVTVPTARLADTLALDIGAGATVVGASMILGDTAVVIGVPFSIPFMTGRDRRGNATGDALQLSVDSGPLTTSGSGFVGTAVGEGRLRTTFAGNTAYAIVRVVPRGQLVLTRGSQAWLAGFDGTGRELLPFTVPSVREPSVSWHPSGDRIVLGGRAGFVVFDFPARRVFPSSWPGGLAGSDVLWPRFGPGGAVYYSSSDGAGAWDIRRMNPDGTSPAIVIPSDRFSRNDFFPDWAPGGGRLILTADWEDENQFLLRLFDPSLSDAVTIGVEGSTPVWSPDGRLIAYWELGAVGVVSPDGATHRRWNPGWAKGVTWSPQGDMLVGIGPQGRIEILDVATGQTLTLAQFGNGNAAVAWRPVVP